MRRFLIESLLIVLAFVAGHALGLFRAAAFIRNGPLLMSPRALENAARLIERLW